MAPTEVFAQKYGATGKLPRKTKRKPNQISGMPLFYG